MLTIAVILWVVAMALGLAAGLTAVLFRRSDVPFMDPSGGTLDLIRNPGRFVRTPYATVVRILIAASFAAGLLAMAFLVAGKL